MADSLLLVDVPYCRHLAFGFNLLAIFQNLAAIPLFPFPFFFSGFIFLYCLLVFLMGFEKGEEVTVCV